MPVITDKFIRTMKVFYQEAYNLLMPGEQGIDDFLFPRLDEDLSAEFAIDELVTNPYATPFREAGEKASVRVYVPGSGQTYPVPRVSDATPISENLRDAVIAGGEVLESFVSSNARLMRNILTQHLQAHNSTRWKLAINTLLTGKFSPTGLDGLALPALEIDYGWDSVNLNITYDFTAVGATMNKALLAMYAAYKTYHAPKQNICVLAGASWLNQFETDTEVSAQRQNTVGNQILLADILPPQMAATHGLYLVARYRVPGMIQPINILGFEPSADFVATNGAAGVPFIGDTKAIMFSTNSPRYKVIRGMDVLDDAGNAQRLVGEVIIDSFTEDNPVSTNLRSNARYAFVPANVNHIVVDTGTF